MKAKCFAKVACSKQKDSIKITPSPDFYHSLVIRSAANFDKDKKENVMRLIASVIRTARQKGIKIGLCGQAPSDMPEFAQFLVNKGIDSISFNADALLKGMEDMVVAESSK